jgi:hypothetical protein
MLENRPAQIEQLPEKRTDARYEINSTEMREALRSEHGRSSGR